jgi:hypothetical protein
MVICWLLKPDSLRSTCKRLEDEVNKFIPVIYINYFAFLPDAVMSATMTGLKDSASFI